MTYYSKLALNDPDDHGDAFSDDLSLGAESQEERSDKLNAAADAKLKTVSEPSPRNNSPAHGSSDNVFLKAPGPLRRAPMSSHSPHCSCSECYSNANERSPLLLSRDDSNNSNYRATDPTQPSSSSPPSYSDATMGRGIYEYSAVGQKDDVERRDRDGKSLDLDAEDPLFAAQQVKSRRGRFLAYWNSRRCLVLFLSVLSTILLIAVIALAASGRSETPVISQPQSPQQQLGKDPFKEGLAYWPPNCGNRSDIKYESWDWDSQSAFHFVESMQRDDQVRSGISGETHIAPAPADQASDIHIDFSVAVTQPLSVQNINAIQSSSGLEVKGVSYDSPLMGTMDCMVLTAVVYMKPGKTMKTLNIDSSNMKVTVHPDLALKVQERTSISLTKGSLKCAAGSIESRETIIDIGSGSVTGSYSLQDLLSIRTKSGAISVDVEPKEEDKAAPRPANFRVRSSSGSVNVKFPQWNLPEREYKTSIEADMGSVTANLVHGSETTIAAYSGSIKAEILPYSSSPPGSSSSSNVTSTLTTNTISGSTKVTLMSPFKDPGTAISSLKSDHRGKSGSIRLTYPQEWTGELQGGTQSGHLTVRGKDVDIIREGGGAAGKRVLARKGDGGSAMTFETMSGSCTIQVGR